ncbi:MAG: VWA domain-containing protein [Candidatus Dormibacteraceae bacterium]
MIVLAGGSGAQPGQGFTFLSPAWLWLFLLLAGLIAVYAVQQLLRRRYAVRFSTVGLLRSVAPRRPGWRRHLAAALMFFCLGSGVVALARPAGLVKVPTQVGTVMVAIDVSLSMQSTDIKPTRLKAAESAATDFVNNLPPSFNVGLVSFSGIASVLVPPTKQHQLVVQGISELQLADSTAIGDGIVASLQAIRLLKGENGGKPPPAALVLLSDGATNMGTPNDQAAADAKAQGVPVSTVALGTPEGTVTIDGQTTPVPVDGPALQRIAQQTGGEYFRSTSAQQLHEIYSHLRQQLGFKIEPQELTAYFIGLAVLFGFLCAAASLLWQPRIL